MYRSIFVFLVVVVVVVLCSGSCSCSCLSIYLSIDRSMDRSIDLSIYRSVDLSICRSVDLSICRSVDLSICRSVDLSICRSASDLLICLSICLSVYLSIDLSIYRSIDLSIYRPRSLSISVYSTARAAEKCQVIRSAAPVMQNHLWKLEDLQNATRLRKSLPWPPNISDEHVSCIAPATRHASLRILFKCPAPAIVFGNATKQIAKRIGTRPSALHSTFHFWRKSRWIASFLMLWTSKIEEVSQTCFVFDSVKFENWGSLAELFRFWRCQVQKLRKSRRIASFSSLQEDRQTDRQAGRQTDPCACPKVLRTRQSFALLTSTCASRHKDMHFFDMSTSKSGPTLRCFVHFDMEICFAPQRRALFRHRNFQKCSEREVLSTFWLQIVLRATTACTFSTCDLPKVLREWCVLHIFTSNTFRPSGATNHWKSTVNRDFSTFSRTCIFFPLTLSLLWSSFFFSSLLFSDSSRLCFSMCPYCRNFLRIVIYCNSN